MEVLRLNRTNVELKPRIAQSGARFGFTLESNQCGIETAVPRLIPYANLVA